MLTFKCAVRHEPDEWSDEGECFTEPSRLSELGALIDQGRLLVAEHWHYRGARCPTRLVVEDYDDFIDYLKSHAIAGDIVDVFDLTHAWKQKSAAVVTGKCPDERGETPKHGAY